MPLRSRAAFTTAAKARNISQSSFSRRIQSLEASLGFSIFDRSANPLQLTNRGKIFVGYARNMLDDMDFQISRIKGLNNTTQKIRIDAAPSLSVLLLPEIIAGYTDRKNKTFHVESINVNDAVFNLKEGKSDFILSFYNEELMNYPFINHKILILTCTWSPLRRTWPPAVSFTSRRAAADEIRQRQLYGAPGEPVIDRTPEITFSLTFVSSMSELLKRMILNGDGVGWLPQYSIQRELDEGRLTILDESLSLPIGAWLYRSGSRLNQAAERFWQHIKTRNEPRE